jgi:hypothetical protein
MKSNFKKKHLYSLQNDLEFYSISQVKKGKQGSEYGGFGNLFSRFGRLARSF